MGCLTAVLRSCTYAESDKRTNVLGSGPPRACHDRIKKIDVPDHSTAVVSRPCDLSIIFEAAEQDQSGCGTFRENVDGQILDESDSTLHSSARRRNIPYMVHADELFYFQICAPDYASSAPTSGQSSNPSMRKTPAKCTEHVGDHAESLETLDTSDKSIASNNEREDVSGLAPPQGYVRSVSLAELRKSIAFFDAITLEIEKNRKIQKESSTDVELKDCHASLLGTVPYTGEKVCRTSGSEAQSPRVALSPMSLTSTTSSTASSADHLSVPNRASGSGESLAGNVKASFEGIGRSTETRHSTDETLTRCSSCQIKPASTTFREFVKGALGWTRISDHAEQHCALGDAIPRCSLCLLKFVSISGNDSDCDLNRSEKLVPTDSRDSRQPVTLGESRHQQDDYSLSESRLSLQLTRIHKLNSYQDPTTEEHSELAGTYDCNLACSCSDDGTPPIKLRNRQLLSSNASVNTAITTHEAGLVPPHDDRDTVTLVWQDLIEAVIESADRPIEVYG